MALEYKRFSVVGKCFLCHTMDVIDRMNKSIFNELTQIADVMEYLTKNDDAKVFYDFLSGSLIWSDEFPRKMGLNYDCLRYVMNFRTGLIIAEPRPEYELAWNQAKRCFPGWIGFSEERVTSNNLLTSIYLHERNKLEAEFS